MYEGDGGASEILSNAHREVHVGEAGGLELVVVAPPLERPHVCAHEAIRNSATERTISGYLETSPRIGVRPDSVQVSGETLARRGCPPGLIGVALTWHASRRTPREERLERGLSCSK